MLQHQLINEQFTTSEVMLESIQYDKTDDKPAVSFDPENGVFEISGRSLPENANSFYDPLEIWLNEYARRPKNETKFVFRLDYFNSASHSKLVKLLICLENIPNKDERVIVKWYYHEDDDLMKIRGEELESIIELPFQLISYS